MSELKRVWVTDTRHPDKPPFLHPEHLLKFSKNLKPATKPGTTKTVREPATTPDQSETTRNTGGKQKEKN